MCVRMYVFNTCAMITPVSNPSNHKILFIAYILISLSSRDTYLLSAPLLYEHSLNGETIVCIYPFLICVYTCMCIHILICVYIYRRMKTKILFYLNLYESTIVFVFSPKCMDNTFQKCSCQLGQIMTVIMLFM